MSIRYQSNVKMLDQYLINIDLRVFAISYLGYYLLIISVKLGQYHGCWCPSSLRRQDISSHDIDYVE